MLPSVGDKYAFAGICILSEYFPSSYDDLYFQPAIYVR